VKRMKHVVTLQDLWRLFSETRRTQSSGLCPWEGQTDRKQPYRDICCKAKPLISWVFGGHARVQIPSTEPGSSLVDGADSFIGNAVNA
jgi:hypothetical protein